MEFQATELSDVYRVQLEPVADDRGHFARTYCADEFRRHGLEPAGVQCNLSMNRHRGTLRGLHYQAEPHAEAKLIRVTRGRLLDVVLDIRRESPTFGRWLSFELSQDSLELLYIGGGLAHGFQTLEDSTEIVYQMSMPYLPEAARGVRWDDPAFDIAWPLPEIARLSDADAARPDFAI